MHGLLQHLGLTLRLNFRSKQALVYGYVVPIFFLFAFGSLFKTQPPLVRELGQLLVITALGGACFGMPTSVVSERERGVWRRYRLLPATTGGLIASTMVARFVIVCSAALLQVVLAMAVYHMPAPAHPWQLAVAFGFVAFAFLGLGLVIAMLADTVPAVQALGQAVFLPMIIIGGVGVPLHTLPPVAQHVAGFLPGYYAVKALDACVLQPTGFRPEGLFGARFELLALVLFGAAGCIAGGRLFRWDVGQRLAPRARGWALLAIIPWAAVGLAAESQGRLGPGPGSELSPILKAVLAQKETPATGPAVVAGTQPTSAPSVAVVPASQPATSIAAATAPAGPPADWQSVTPAHVAGISFADLEPDDGTVTPVAPNFDNLSDEGKKRMEDLRGKLADWRPAAEDDVPQRVRNVLSVAGIPDVLQDPNEAEIPLVAFDQLKNTVANDDLVKALAYVILKPDEGSWVVRLTDLGWDVELPQDQVRDRGLVYARKLLGRLLGKLPPKAP